MSRGRRALLPILFAAGALIGYLLATAGGNGTAPPAAPDRAARADELREEIVALRAELLAKAAGPPPSSPDPAPLPPLETPVRTGGKSVDPESGDLRIRVTDGGGRPRPGLSIYVKRPDRVGNPIEEYDLLTDASGSAELTGLVPARHWVRIRSGRGSRTLRCHVVAGKVTDTTLPLPDGTTVTGRVLHAEGRGVPGVEVVLVGQGAYTDVFTGEADSGGHYRIEDVFPGRYEVSVLGGAPGYRLRDRWALTVGPHLVTRDIRIDVPTLCGVVLDRDTDEPVPDVKVYLHGDPGIRLDSVTDARGEFRFLDLPAGRYRLTITADGYATASAEAQVDEGEERREEVRLTPAATVILVVKDPRGEPYAGSLVLSYSALPRGSSYGTTIATDAKGIATFRRIPPGSYTLRVRAKGLGEARLEEVTIAPGENRFEVFLE